MCVTQSHRHGTPQTTTILIVIPLLCFVPTLLLLLLFVSYFFIARYPLGCVEEEVTLRR